MDTQFESYLQEELKVKHSLHNHQDSRIHACLSIMAPSGHSLKSLDLVIMKNLDSKFSFLTTVNMPFSSKFQELLSYPTGNLLMRNAVPADLQVEMVEGRIKGQLHMVSRPLIGRGEGVHCGPPAGRPATCDRSIIPVIAKTDTSSKSELHKFKIKIMSELASNGVQIFQFPTDGDQHGHECMCWNIHLPLVMVVSTEEVNGESKTVPLGCSASEQIFLNENVFNFGLQCDQSKLKEERKTLEEEMLSFSTRRPAAQLFKAQSLNTNDGSK
ncbi:hypothetical protein P4O66_008075, partial [Electrophorus voltai]